MMKHTHLLAAVALLLGLLTPRGNGAPLGNGPQATLFRCKAHFLETFRERFFNTTRLMLPFPTFRGIGVLHEDPTAPPGNRTEPEAGKKGSTLQPPEIGVATLTHSPPPTPNAAQLCLFSFEIFVSKLGWSPWILLPQAFNYTLCVPCSTAEETFHQWCSSHFTGPQPPPLQEVHRCGTRQPKAPLTRFLLAYGDDALAVVHVPLTATCGCQ
ncbi:unnamed protein product [Lampetra planeri]